MLVVVNPPKFNSKLHDEEEALLKVRTAALERDIASVKSQYLQTFGRIQTMEEKLSEMNSDRVSTLEELQVELSDMFTKLQQEAEANNSTENTQQRQERERQKQNWEREIPPSREEHNSRIEQSAEVKKLFRRISKKTHPDKTKDPILKNVTNTMTLTD